MLRETIFTGTGTALVTPFTEDGAVDVDAMKRHVDHQIAGGVSALIVLGTTGENATVWPDERRVIVDAVIEHVDGRVAVVIGTGNNSTSESIQFSREATDAGADGLLIVGPYYNKPGQAGFKAHVRAIADVTDCPIIVYNVPGRTGFNIQAETVLELAEDVPSVLGVKEASGSLAQISDILAGRPDSLAVYAGDDEIVLPLIALGGDGVVSVISNAIPEPFSRLVQLCLDGRIDEARELHFQLLPAMRACFIETNPTPIKAVLAAMGMMSGKLRLPLVEMEEKNRQQVLDAFGAFVGLRV